MTPDICKTIQLIPLDCSSTFGEHKFQHFLQQNDVHVAEASAWDALRPAVEQTIALLNRLPRSSPWGSYLMADTSSREIVGICGFKGAPANELVEIAYFTFPYYEGRGYATLAAAALTSLAEASAKHVKVIARTLMEYNASTRVLTKCGFLFAGEVIDPEDGRVWQWERCAPSIEGTPVNNRSSAT